MFWHSNYVHIYCMCRLVLFQKRWVISMGYIGGEDDWTGLCGGDNDDVCNKKGELESEDK